MFRFWRDYGGVCLSAGYYTKVSREKSVRSICVEPGPITVFPRAFTSNGFSRVAFKRTCSRKGHPKLRTLPNGG